MAHQEIFIIFIISARFLQNHDSHRSPNFYWRSTTYNEQVLPKKCVSNAILKKRSSFENVKWEYRNMSFLRKIVILHYLMTRIDHQFFYNKGSVVHISIYSRRIIWGLFKKISSDYGSGAFPPTINPMKWEPRTPLRVPGPRSSIGG